MPSTVAAQPDADLPSDDKILRLSLDAFEGPLDLLLHLIRKHQLDIFDIPVAFVTEEYLKYLEDAAENDLGVAGEYLVMATTLLQIKSAMLLPKPETEDDEEDEEDPREALIRRLLIYQSFKDAAERINERERLFRDVFPRPELPDRPLPPRTIDDIEPPNVFELTGALYALLRAKRTPPVHEVTRHELSIKDSILRIAQYLDAMPRTTFNQLVALAPHDELTHRAVITFMGLLEMAKLRLITLFQARLRSDDLIVERAVLALEEVALQLDFSDPQVVSGPTNESSAQEGDTLLDKDETEEGNALKTVLKDHELEKIEAHEVIDEIPAIPAAVPQDDDALMDARRAAMRGRPRYVPPEAFVRQNEDDDAETLALSQLHAALDDYDLDAVLQQALELSIVRPKNNAEHTRAPHIDADAFSESQDLKVDTEAPDVSAQMSADQERESVHDHASTSRDAAAAVDDDKNA